MRKVDEIYRIILELEGEKNQGVTTSQVADLAGIARSNASRYLNQLHNRNKLEKIEGRPVLYKLKDKDDLSLGSNLDKEKTNYSFNKMVGADQSLSSAIEQAKSAIIYPPKGLHTLILGETGVGKSLFAEQMYNFALESKVLDQDTPFIRFNCADYTDNPALLTAQT